MKLDSMKSSVLMIIATEMKGLELMKRYMPYPYPFPKDESPLFFNEKELADPSRLDVEETISQDPDTEEDNVRIYIPLDLNQKAILRRLDDIISRYVTASEKNEMRFSVDVYRLLSQLEIYDRRWYLRHMPPKGEHSVEGVKLAKEIIQRLESIPEGDSEFFPYDLIDELNDEYLSCAETQ